eukprot:3773467-Prymnesium_polylepis.1
MEPTDGRARRDVVRSVRGREMKSARRADLPHGCARGGPRARAPPPPCLLHAPQRNGRHTDVHAAHGPAGPARTVDALLPRPGQPNITRRRAADSAGERLCS